MANLSVKDVPEAIAEKLRQRAARNHRSLQGELMAIVERAVREGDPPVVSSWQTDPAPTGASVRALIGPIHRGHKTIEQIAMEHRAIYPEPIGDGPISVDIVRAEREITR